MSDPTAEAPEDAPAPTWAQSLLTFDMDAHAAAQGDWSLHYEQLSSGRFRGELSLVQLVGVRLTEEKTSLALRQQLDDDRLSLRAWDAAGDPQPLRGRDLDASSLRLDLSLDHELGRGRYLGLGYAGRFAEQAREQALALRLSLRF